MNNYEQLIDKLAAKLSVPAAHLWGILVRQAEVQAISNLVSLALSIIALAILVKVTPRLINYIEDTDKRDPGEDMHGGWFCLGIFSWIGCSVWVFVAGVGAYNAIGFLLNPEYYALRQILDAVK